MTMLYLVRKASIAAAMATGISAAACAAVIAPTDGYSVYNGNIVYGPEFAGDAAQGDIGRLYEKFLLPALTSGNYVQSAIFHIAMTRRWNEASNPLGLYAVVSDTWTGEDNWAAKPALGGLILSFNPGSYVQHHAFDVTAFVNSQYLGDGGASLAIAGLTEGAGQNSWTYFDPASAMLALTLTTANTVAEPASIALFGLGLVGLAALRRRK